MTNFINQIIYEVSFLLSDARRKLKRFITDYGKK